LKQSLHDLNAMALTGLLSLYVSEREGDVVDPPFLPAAGIALGQQLATNLTAAVLKSRQLNQVVKTKVYLYETAKEIFVPLWPQDLRDKNQTRFLHNGAYPCYSLYRTKDDHYVGIAAVEEKFYLALQGEFGLEVPADKRFEKDPAYFEQIAKVFTNLTLEEIGKRIEGKDLCLSLIEKL